jgi:hypothetical protein
MHMSLPKNLWILFAVLALSLSAALPVQAADQKPGKGVAIRPDGTQETNPLALVWQEDPLAEKYWLWIDSPATGQVIWDQWVSLSEISCDSGAGTCTYTVPVSLDPGGYVWWVLPANAQGHGIWSESKPFTLGGSGSKPSAEPDIMETPASETPEATETPSAGVETPPVSSPEAGDGHVPDAAVLENPVQFSWEAEAGATAYWLWIDDASGEKVHDHWVDADAAGCTDGAGTCQATLEVEFEAGAYTWWLLPSEDHAHGEWRPPKDFWVLPGGFDRPPGKGILISPVDVVVENPVTLTWQPDPLASEYWLWIDDAAGQVVWEHWVNPVAAGCLGAAESCSFTLPLDLAFGNYIWWVLPANGVDYGEWSDPVGMTLYDGTCSLSLAYPECVRQWCGLIEQAAADTGLPAGLIAAVMYQESKGDPLAYSSSGAVGLMQVMPRDGIAANFRCSAGPCFADRPTIAELQDPAFNVAYGSRMLADLYSRYGSYREALFRYGPINMGYYYADKVLNFWYSFR